MIFMMAHHALDDESVDNGDYTNANKNVFLCGKSKKEEGTNVILCTYV